MLWPALICVVIVAVLAGVAGHALARLRQRDALRDVRTQHRLMTQLLDVWLWQTDREHRLVRLVPPQDAAAGSGVPALAGTPLLWECFETAADAPPGLRERLQSHAPLTDLCARRPDVPAVAEWRLRGLPDFDRDGAFAGYLGTARPLQPQAAAPVVDPEAAAEHEAFGYTVSHDLRAPLRVVEGFARIVIEDYGRVLDRIGRDHLERVLGAAARMNQMIDALLVLSQLSAQPLARQPVNLSQLAGYVADDLRREQPQRRVEVAIEPGLMAEGDPTLLRLVLENLIGNAWKYTGRTDAARIAFERTAHEGRPAFVVRDNGAGFDMRFADRLFGVFQRLHSASDFAGTGVGLASVRRIVRRHGGQIWAEGEVGAGARFYFTLGG